MSDDVVAVANLVWEDDYKSQAERAWGDYGNMVMSAILGKNTVVMHYEPIILRFPGANYKPDFMHICDDGEIVFVEVKGSKKQRGYTTTRQKVRSCSKIYPYFTFVEAIGKKMDWQLEVINQKQEA